MEVKSVSAYQPSFNGYINKKMVKYINTIVKKQISSEVAYASNNHKEVDIDKLEEISSFGKNVISNFKNYLSKLHKDTSLEISSNNLKLKNPVSKTTEINIIPFGVGRPAIATSHTFIGIPFYYSLRRTDLADFHDLNILDKISKFLQEVNPKEIDNAFVERANYSLMKSASKTTDLIGKFKMRNWAKKIDKFAKEVGEEQTARTNVEKYLAEAQEHKNIKMHNKKMQKQIEKENKKIGKKFLNS